MYSFSYDKNDQNAVAPTVGIISNLTFWNCTFHLTKNKHVKIEVAHMYTCETEVAIVGLKRGYFPGVISLKGLFPWGYFPGGVITLGLFPSRYTFGEISQLYNVM